MGWIMAYDMRYDGCYLDVDTGLVHAGMTKWMGRYDGIAGEVCFVCPLTLAPSPLGVKRE